MLSLMSTTYSGIASGIGAFIAWFVGAVASAFGQVRDFMAPRLVLFVVLALMVLFGLMLFGPVEESDAQTVGYESGPLTYAGYSEMCEASYYGGPLIGNYTASGEIFTGEAGTAAHSWLPFGTIVRVDSPYGSTNLRITDRGPYIAGRCIDVSEGSNWIVGGYTMGVAPVVVTVVG